MGAMEPQVTTNGEGLELDPLRPLRGERLAIVGFSESTRALAPFDDPSVEVWICNRLGIQSDIRRWDRHFDPHPLEWSAVQHDPENWRTYKEFLEVDYGDRMVYLPHAAPQCAVVPNLVDFPKDDVVAEIGRDYFASVIGWQIGLALLLHTRYGSPKAIDLYGIDLRGKTEYDFQRPNVEYLLGIAEGRGIAVTLPKESSLLNCDGSFIQYGFDIYSGFMGEMEMALDARAREVRTKLDELQAQKANIERQLLVWDGARQELVGWHTRVINRRRGGKL